MTELFRNIVMHAKTGENEMTTCYPATYLGNIIDNDKILMLREELAAQDVGDGTSFFINALDVTETGIYWGTAEAYGWNKFPPRSGPFILEAVITPGGQTMRRVTFTDNGEVYICVGTGSTGWVKI